MIQRLARRALISLGALFTGFIVPAQCPNDNSVLGSVLSVSCPGSVSGGCVTGGEYVRVNVTSGLVYTFSTCDASWNTHITLYNGGSGSSLASNDDGCSNNRSAVQWTATYTGQVRVLVDRSNCNTNGTCAPLWITCSLNDDRCSSTLLTVGSSCTNSIGTNAGATTSGGTDPSCSNYAGGDVWFRFVAPATGRTTVSTSTISGSSLSDAAMAIYSASACGATFTEVACNNDSPLGGGMPLIHLTGLTPSATYWVRVWDVGNNDFGTFNICAYDAPLANDDPCGATLITPGASCTNTTSTNFTATNSSVTAPSCGNHAGGDVWFRFTGPANGQITITGSVVSGSALTDGAMAIYSATACGGTFTELICRDDGGSGAMPSTQLVGLTSGATYYVRFWEYGNNDFGQFNICATTPAAVSNDDPCSATVLAVGTSCTNTIATTGGATNTAGVGTPTCGNYLGNDIWFRIVAPSSGRLRLSTSTVAGSALANAAMALYSAPACGGTMTQIACNDDSFSGAMPELAVSGLTAGTSYYARVWANSNSAYGQFNICATEPPAHDEPCGAIALTVGSSCSMASQTNVAAGYSGDAPLPGCGSLNAASHDVWFRFTAPTSGIVIIESTSGTMTDGSMALYGGSTCSASSLTLIQCSADEGMGNMPFLRFADLTPGGTYYLRYWGSGNAEGTFNLCVWSPTMPSGSCVYFLELWDSGENGWGTSAVQTQLNSSPVVNTTVAAADFYECRLIGVNSGDMFQVSYVNSGPNQSQNRYQIRQVPGGFGVLSQGPSPSSGISLLETIDCVPPDSPREDCRGGTSVCGGQSFNDNPNGTGFDVDLRYTTFGCLSSAERQGTWYKFSPSANGTIGVTIAPSNTGDDYDFAVWGPESSIICPPSKQPQRCSYSGSTGNTGMRTSSADSTEDASGDKWVSAINAIAGQRYVLYISNYSQSGLSFSLSWQLSSGASLDCSLLPVDFIDLQAELKGDAVEVMWSTAAEEGASHYIVERSADAFDYLPIGTVQAAGNTSTLSSYSFLDEAPLEGLNYYRVQQVDSDGSTMYSSADHAIYRKGGTSMVVFPNPAGDILWASFEMPEDDAVIWRVLNAAGQLIEQDLYQGTKGNMLIDIPLERFSPGTYTLLVNDARGHMSRSAQFVKR